MFWCDPLADSQMIFFPSLHVVEIWEKNKALWSLFRRTLTPSWGYDPHDLITSQKSHHLIPLPCEIIFSPSYMSEFCLAIIVPYFWLFKSEKEWRKVFKWALAWASNIFILTSLTQPIIKRKINSERNDALSGNKF